MGMAEEFLEDRKEAALRQDEHTRTMLVGAERKLRIAFARIEQLEKEITGMRLEFGEELAKRDERDRTRDERLKIRFDKLDCKVSEEATP